MVESASIFGSHCRRSCATNFQKRWRGGREVRWRIGGCELIQVVHKDADTPPTHLRRVRFPHVASKSSQTRSGSTGTSAEQSSKNGTDSFHCVSEDMRQLLMCQQVEPCRCAPVFSRCHQHFKSGGLDSNCKRCSKTKTSVSCSACPNKFLSCDVTSPALVLIMIDF